ncbi:MBOAT, membrane-bound O-acyltransferase family-domain-containing protein [Pterulicium gracile]|uniref:MBOAT, membrane-bound O-acyltransferase family-domain-containing protein n=1 Tax=Pterulicium gracile TaxID=1884261 RepID=A0A5C3Q7W7_9AGAR|nr:MBOAT, membrane-bound O-acyltransferase family-domain-containing protein [Pterula gracilis]
MLPLPTSSSSMSRRSHKPWSITDLTVDVPSKPPPSSRPSTTPHNPNAPRNSNTHRATNTNAPRTSRSALPPEAHFSATSPPRWKSPEFYLYYLLALFILPLMIILPIRVSLATHPSFMSYAPRLSWGWIHRLLGWVPGAVGERISSGQTFIPLYVDNSDAQYRGFRNNLWVLTIFVGSWISLKHGIIYATSQTRGTVDPIQRNLILAIISLFVLHGSSAIKVILLCAASCGLALVKWERWWMRPMVVWTFNALVLWTNDRWDGYKYGDLGGEAWAFLDEWRGAYPRWDVSFNITTLRLIAFGMDYHWALASSSPTTSPSSQDPAPPSGRPHTKKPSLPLQSYTLPTALAYALYTPLYIAGPIMGFDDWVVQVALPGSGSGRREEASYLLATRILSEDSTSEQDRPSSSIPNQKAKRQPLLSYTLRFLTTLLVMELVLHFMHVVAIKDARAWGGGGVDVRGNKKEYKTALIGGYTVAELGMVAFWNLIVVWLKLLLPWRFFRLWALLDGVDPPENMVRCMANNYSTMGFWRSWHRSYNIWILRYIYIPLSGSRHAFLNGLVVFTFVALWHDLTFKLLMWGWMAALIVGPEMLVRGWVYGKSERAARLRSKSYFRHLCALAGALNILLLMLANLVGFVLGVDGVVVLWGHVWGGGGGWEGLKFLATTIGVLFVGVQLMFEYREAEARAGIFRGC